ncbi:alpha/beta hydrolase [Exiguobacterium sp. AM39-5BH]|uniref:alpha/beta hydrolase n=1 Tax=Exiguobacterium sp. AM39-5BH TaxID=2292355 RepID=UPI000FE24EFE|nr:alpha/beta hydrolase [Exiguobacterium sp. AM39-5BH]RHB51687.1 alpha/beta hydrolase [Exiguobacterium sp. AM39-5BH]
MTYEEESPKGVIVIVYPLQFTSRLSEVFLGRLRDEYEVLVVAGQTVGLTAEDHKLLIKNTLREASQYKLPIHVIAFSLGALLTNRLLQEYDVPLGSLTYISPLFDWHPSRQIGGLKQVVASAVDRFRPDLPLGMMTFMGSGEESSRFGEITYGQYREIEEEIVEHQEEKKHLPRLPLACFYAPDDRFADVKLTLNVCRKIGGDQVYIRRLEGFPHFGYERLNTKFAETLLTFYELIRE